MAQSTQPVTLGDPQAMQWRCHWMPAPGLQAPELCWARLELHVQGQQLWGECDPHEGQMAWPLVDLLGGVARIWPWLLLEEAYPIDIHPEHLGLMMGAAEQRWSDLPEVQAHAEEDALFDFRQRHDLSMLWRGLNVAPLWLLRQGLDCQVWSPKLTKPVFIPHQVVMNSLQQLGDLLANHIALSDAATRHPRAQQALTRWQQRDRETDKLSLGIVTGLQEEDIVALVALAGKESPVMKAFMHGHRPAANDEACPLANELQMAARMSRDRLDSVAQLALLESIHGLPKTQDSPQLEQLCRQVPIPDGTLTSWEQGYALANWLRSHLTLPDTQAVEPVDILRQLGVPPQDMSINGCIDAAAVWGPEHGPAILVNRHALSRAKTLNGLRTTLAHELCHLLVDRQNALPVVEVLGGQVARSAEKRANAFAAELLLPRSSAVRAVHEMVNLQEALVQLQVQYKVSREVVYHQICNSEIYQSLSRFEQREIERWKQEL